MERKLVQLPGTRLSPTVTLHRTLDKVERIKNVVIVIQWDDDTFDVDWSQMKISEMALGSLLLNEKVRAIALGLDPDTIKV